MDRRQKQNFEQVINDVYSGIGMFVRDINLEPQHLVQCQQGMVIREKSFTDASSRVGGMITRHRISILSNHMRNFSEFEHDTNWGLCVAQKDSHFKVLDIYEFQGQTQILLLHLPDDQRWEMFVKMNNNLDEDIILDCRKRFEVKCNLPPIPELATEGWLRRCAYPIGMDDARHLFELKDKPMSVHDTSFRQVYHRVSFVHLSEKMSMLEESFHSNGADNGVIVYGYIDHEVGFTFEVLCTACKKDAAIIWGKPNDEVFLKLRKRAISDCLIEPLCEQIYQELTEHERKIDMIDKAYQTKESAIVEMREIRELDQFRHSDFPDDIATLLVRDGLQLEQVWVRCKGIGDVSFLGILLNKPDQNFGIHVGDEISFLLVKQENELFCISQQ